MSRVARWGRVRCVLLGPHYWIKMRVIQLDGETGFGDSMSCSLESERAEIREREGSSCCSANWRRAKTVRRFPSTIGLIDSRL